jgi:hypothetical protein
MAPSLRLGAVWEILVAIFSLLTFAPWLRGVFALKFG